MPPIDLRSDTVTRPTPAMRQAIANAEVGDDVIDVDPTCRRLEELTAELLGKEAALFMPSGTMTNQVGVRIHCKPGDEFICEAGCHIYNYEQGAFAQLSGVVARTVEGEAGVLHVDQLRGLIRPENDHLVRTRLVCLENTHNRGAGKVQPYDERRRDLRLGPRSGPANAPRRRSAVERGRGDGHLPKRMGAALRHGQRLLQQGARRTGRLGAGRPEGSDQGSPPASQAVRRRHAAGRHHRRRGAVCLGAQPPAADEDHANAQILADAVRRPTASRFPFGEVDTNIVIFRVEPKLGSAAEFVAELKTQNVWCLAIGPQQVRLVTHLDVSEAQCRQAAKVLLDTVARLASGKKTAKEPEWRNESG